MSHRKRLRHMARKLTTAQLQSGEDAALDMDDLSLFDLGQRGSDRFLGCYSKQGLKLALEKYGLLTTLARKGFRDVRVHVDTDDPFQHRLRLDDHALGHEAVIGELVVRRENMNLRLPKEHPLAMRNFSMLAIEWLYVQDPRASFDSKRPQLPGQEHPGLGLARTVLELLMLICRRLNLAGVLNHPAHFHNAVMGTPLFQFIDPLRQANFEALQRDMAAYHLQAVTWAIAWDCVFPHQNRCSVNWQPDRFVLALDDQLKAYFNSPYYKNLCWQNTGHEHFQLDEDLLLRRAAHSKVFIPRIRR